MSKGERDELKFLDTLSHDLASEVLEDESACAEAVALGPDVNAAIVRAREVASRAIAEQRRARIAALGRCQPAARMTPGRYRELRRDELLKLVEERHAAVEHRDLTSVPDEDLRTLLEDLDALENDEHTEE